MKKLLIIVFLLFLILLPNVKSKEIESKINKIKVDIKGYVINPGVYELEENSTVYDQTTPNMIQRISGIFQRNPLIYADI